MPNNNNPVSDSWARRIIRSVKFTENLRGDNLRRTGDSAYIGSSDAGETSGNTDWRPRQYQVKSEENDYLVCVPYNSKDETAGTKEYKVAKHPRNRGDDVLRGTRTGYVVDETVVWAAPFRANGAEDADGNAITLMEVFPPGSDTYYAKVTASSSSVADITLAEVDSAGDVLAGGRTPADAQVPNERKGVPVDTFGMAFELPPTAADGEIVTKFVPWDGLTTTPKDLILDGLTADTTTYDIEADSEPVQVNNGRVWFGTPIAAFFWRDTTYDASGMQTLISDESRFRLIADLDDASYEGAIAFVADGLDGGYLKHNQPQATTYTVELTSVDGSIEFDIGAGAASSVDITFDEGGHLNTGNLSIDLSATIGGSADGQGFEDIEVNGVRVLAKTDGGIIDFQDKASPTAGHAAVEFSGSAADPQATIEGEVNIDAYLKSLAGYVGGNKQMLGHTDAGVITWFNTAECP